MKSWINLLLWLLAADTAVADDPAIQSALLDDRVVYTVPVATNRVTTLSFPSPVTAMDGAGITGDVKTPGQFQLAHTRGTAFLSIRALAPKAVANLNIRWNKRTYVFELMESDKPVLSLILEGPPSREDATAAPELTPARLVGLLDKAKAFPLLKKQQPEAVAGVEFISYAEKPLVTDCNDYEIRLEEAFRFDTEDTLIFHATLKNKTGQPIAYRPGSFSVRAGNRIYPQSISDAPGIMPPNSETTVYFAVSGTPDGGRNELSLKNDFTVLLERFANQPSKPAPPSTEPPK